MLDFYKQGNVIVVPQIGNEPDVIMNREDVERALKETQQSLFYSTIEAQGRVELYYEEMLELLNSETRHNHTKEAENQ